MPTAHDGEARERKPTMSELTEVKVTLGHLKTTVDELKSKMDQDAQAWSRVAAELATLNGSLKILLEDRGKHEKAVERLHARIDTETRDRNAAIHELDERVTAAEQSHATLVARQASTHDSTNRTRNVLWDIGKMFVAGIIGAIFVLITHADKVKAP